MDAEKENYFTLDVIDFVLQVVGRPLPCHLQRKLDKYINAKYEKCLTLNIKKAIMIHINQHLVSKQTREHDASNVYEEKLKELFKEYTPNIFLKTLAHFAYESVLDFINNKEESPEAFVKLIVDFLTDLRDLNNFANDSWRLLDKSATTLVEENGEKNNYGILRKSNDESDMAPEKGFVLMIINFVFDFCSRDLPIYLKEEFDKYKSPSENDAHFKNAIFVVLNELGKKERMMGDEIEPIVLYYYNLCSKHFTEKYFIEFCVCITKKAMMEYFIEDRDWSPFKAYELCIYLLRLAKEDGKYRSLDAMSRAAAKILDEDQDRIEHERLRSDLSSDNSNESEQQVTTDNQSENLLEASEQVNQGRCASTCCTMT